MRVRHHVSLTVALSVLGAAIFIGPTNAAAQELTTIHIAIKAHRFQPSELSAPANVPLMLKIKNLDPAPMEFESVSLRVERVVPGSSEGQIRIRPLSPGRYTFFDDFHPDAQGVLTIR